MLELLSSIHRVVHVVQKSYILKPFVMIWRGLITSSTSIASTETKMSANGELIVTLYSKNDGSCRKILC